MKLLTLNCHSWQEKNQLKKIKYLAKVIKEKSYDVIALQEVSQSINEEIEYDNIKKDNFVLILMKELRQINVDEYNFVWDFSHIGYDIYEEGVAILTKHPIIEEYSFFVSQSSDIKFWKSRKIVGVKVSYYNNPISFYSCHLGWWNDKEEPFNIQVDNLITNINKNENFFIMGDFNNNAFIRNEGYDYLINYKLYDTYNLASIKDEGITVKGKIAGWEKNKQNLRLDIILTNKKLNVKSSKAIFNDINKFIISDHFGVENEINFI